MPQRVAAVLAAQKTGGFNIMNIMKDGHGVLKVYYKGICIHILRLHFFKDSVFIVAILTSYKRE